MRRFHSYVPVDSDIHFAVPRTELVQDCLNHIVGETGKGGHYFTIWSPRQTGKTWLMRQVKARIERDYPDRFVVGTMSMQGLLFLTTEPVGEFLQKVPKLFLDTFSMDIGPPQTYEQWALFFHRTQGLFKKPLILFVDEFDSLPSGVIDQLVTLFRDMHLNRSEYMLHGLALIGVRAALGVDSPRGSPFNIQRSLHVANLTRDEVVSMFDQYQTESGQAVDPDVVQQVFEVTLGQPGLVGWFGELLTEKYNPGMDQPIGREAWETVYRKALHVEWNNTVLNLVKKVRTRYTSYVLELFARSDIGFSMDADWCAYLYLNGIIIPQTIEEPGRETVEVCRFSCPFIQKRLYNALTHDLIGDRLPILALEILDDLADVFESNLDLPALLSRYRAYLVRMKAKGLNPFREQPRRKDLHYTEAVGHFHLYAWLKEALDRMCIVSPEFPTGNGKVDIHIRCRDMEGIIEVKSFRSPGKTREAIVQAADYGKKLGLDAVTLALFVPTDEKSVLDKLTTRTDIDGVTLDVVAIGWT
ncbi:MAG: hypothetical protein AB7S77_00460 [Desulfatirhabdiaceae bacterium]